MLHSFVNLLDTVTRRQEKRKASENGGRTLRVPYVVNLTAEFAPCLAITGPRPLYTPEIPSSRTIESVP